MVPPSWLKEIHPIRGLDVVAGLQAAADTYAPLREQRLAVVRSTLEHPGTDADLSRAGLQALGRPGGLLRRAVAPVPTPLGEAVVAAVVLAQVGWGNEEKATQALVDSWWAQHPVELVVQAAVHLTGLGLVGHPTQTLHRRSTGTTPWNWRAMPSALLRLRRLLCGADDATYDRATRALEHVLGEPNGTIVAAYLVPTRRDWVSTALASGAPSQAISSLWPMLLSCALTVDEAAQVLHQTNAWFFHQQPSLLTSGAAHVGPSATEPLLTLAEKSAADTSRRIFGLLAAFPGDEPFGALLERLDHKGVSEAVLKAREIQPFRATRMLAEGAAGTGAKAAACAALLRSHVPGHPQTRAVAPLLSPPARTALQKAAPAQIDVPFAAPDQLPPVLAQAPWDRKRSAAKLVVVAGLVPSVPTRVVWREGERDQWRSRSVYTPSDWDRELRTTTWGYVWRLAVAPPQVGRRYLARAVQEEHLYCNVADAKALLAQYEADAVPLLLAIVRDTPNWAEALLPVESVEVAQAMAGWLTRRSLRATAVAWLHRHPDAAASALIPQALSGGKERLAAEKALRLLATRDRSVVESAAETYGPAAVAGISALLAADPLEALPARIPGLPTWLHVQSLPPVLLGDRSARLDADAVRRLLQCLALGEPDEPYAGAEQALAALDRASVARAAWALFEGWRLAGEPAKDGWVLRCQGMVGDDDTARELTPVVLAWPKQGGSTKAVTGLTVLAGIGTDVALMHLHRISQRAPSRPLREKAAAMMQQVADDLGLSTEQLADRLVPDMGLDADGRAVLDYGPRQFVVGFDEALKPYVEEGGKRRSTLPKPGAKDDAEVAAPAYARFTALKKDVRTVAADQLRRLESAMAGSRRWTAEEHRRLFVEHPLMWHLTRRLVWGVFGDDGNLRAAFRVAEDRTLADRDDEELRIADDATVGIAHPLHLGDELGIWTELFADYEILQPFPQLGRETMCLTDEEKTATALTRFAGAPVETKRVYGLASRGWERGEVEDGGVQGYLVKQLPGDLLGIVDLDPGILVGYPDEEPEQRFVSVKVRRAVDGVWGRSEGLAFGALDGVTASELLRDLSRVAGG